MGGQNHHGSSLVYDDTNSLLDMNTGTFAATADLPVWPAVIAEVATPGVPMNGTVVTASASGTSAQFIVTDARPPNTLPLAAPAIVQSVLVTSGNLTINLEFDAAAQAAPASFLTGMEQAATLLTEAISVDKPITVNMQVQYNENGISNGSAYANAEGAQSVSYSTVRSDLIANAAPGDPNFNSLSTGPTVQGQSLVTVYGTQLKAFGLLPGNNSAEDGFANFSSAIASDALVGVALHELTHAMGRVPAGAPYSSLPNIFDLYRFTSPGTILIQDSWPGATPSYFSVDGGNIALADYGINTDPSDFLNSALTPNDAFNHYCPVKSERTARK